MLPCEHSFHKNCYEDWLNKSFQSSNSCPEFKWNVDNILTSSDSDQDSVKNLLKIGCWRLQDGYDSNLILLCAVKKKMDLMRLIIETVEFDSSTKWSYFRALCVAADSGNIEMSKMLIEKGADLLDYNKRGFPSFLILKFFPG